MRPLWTIIYCIKLYGHCNALFLMIPLPTSGPGNQEELAWLPDGVLAMTPCLLLDFWVTLMRNNGVTFQDCTKHIHGEQNLGESWCCVAGSSHPLPSRGLSPPVNHSSASVPTKTLTLVLVQVCIVTIHLGGARPQP